MTMMLQRLVLTLCLLALPQATTAQEAVADPGEQKRLALEYLGALADADWEKQKTFYTDESVFEDPTADLFGEPWRLSGADEITDFWRTNYESSGTLGVVNTFDRIFVNGSRVILVYEARVRFDGVQVGFPGEQLEGTIQGVTVLRIEGGKVLHHLDHVDYAGAQRDLEAMRADLEARSTSP
ncbi:MAG: nuclear transport factor 2 family protein [Acidobacteriota bacterium]